MKNISSIQKDLIVKIGIILERYNLNSENFLYTKNKNNPKAHAEILELLAKCIDSPQDKVDLTIKNREVLLKLVEDGVQNGGFKSSPNYQIGNILKNYLTEFYDFFFTIENNQIKLTQTEDFQLPSMEDKPDFKKNLLYIKYKMSYQKNAALGELELILLPDGTTYYAPQGHEGLAYWLNLSGVDLNQAIRLESVKSMGDFNFSSLRNDKFIQKDEDNEMIEISSAQANFLGVLYGTLSNGWAFMQPLDHQLRLTKGFGIGKTETFEPEGISGKNLRKLDIYMGDHFNKGEYVREAMLSNDTHNPLN